MIYNQFDQKFEMNMRLNQMNQKIEHIEKSIVGVKDMQGQIMDELKSLRTHKEASVRK